MPTLIPTTSHLLRLQPIHAERYRACMLQAYAEHPDAFTKCAGSLVVEPVVESADTEGVLMGRLLLLDVLPKNVNRRTVAT
jgi:hypothetical protein